MERPLDEILVALIVCAEAWEPGVRILGNVRADDMREALYRALQAVEFVKRTDTDDSELLSDLKALVLEEGAWAHQYLGAPLPTEPT